MNKYNTTLKTTSLFGGVQSLNIVLNIVRTKLVALLIGPEGVGLNAIFNESRELIHSTTNLGLDVSGVRGVSAAYENWESATGDDVRSQRWNDVCQEVIVLRSWVLLLALFGALVCMLLARPLSLANFDSVAHTTDYIILAPAVAFSTMNCGELAVLKGLRRIKSLALANVLYVVLGIVVNVPIYFVWGISGVVPALVAFTFASLLLTCSFSFRTMPLAFVFQKAELRRGHKMLSVGLTFVITTVLSKVVLLFIMGYLNRVASEEMVGLYVSAYTLTMTYAGVVFSALDQDYFPHLSGVISSRHETNSLLLKQLDVTVMLITPLLAIMVVALPVAVPLLLSGEFDAIIPMAQISVVGVIFRAINIPNGLLPLAAGDNKTFLAMNFVGALDVLLVIAGWHLGGLTGMGICLTIQNFIDMAIAVGVAHCKYGVIYGLRRVLSLLGYILLLAAVYASSTLLSGWAYWLVGIIIISVTALYSYSQYRNA